MQIPADLGDNATYEDYLEEAKLAAFYAAEDTDEQIVQLLVRDEDFMINQQGWNLDINEAIRIVKELRAR
jgi:hypothetical protein